MFHRKNNKKHAVTPYMEAEIARTENQQKKADFDLAEAKTIAAQLKEIREANHFTQGFRKSLGINNGN